MAIRLPNKLLIVGAMVLAAGAAWPNPVAVSLRPQDGSKPTAKLEDRSVSTAAQELFDLLHCVDELAQGQFAKGENSCSSAIALNPKNSLSYKLRGYGYLLEHRFERAVADFQFSLKLKPDDAESRAGYAQSLSGEGKFAAAVAEFGKAIAMSPAKGTYWSGRCWARAGTGRQLGRALADCNQALALMPGSAGALNSRGMVRLRLSQFQVAISDYTHSLAAKSGQPSAQFGRGLARLRLGQTEAGADDIALARKGDTEIDSLFVLMGVLPPDCIRRRAKANCPPAPAAPMKKSSPNALVLASFQRQNYDDDDVVLAIEVERLDIMLDQITFLLHQPPAHREALRLGDTPNDLWIQISGDVTRFNRLSQIVCRPALIRAFDCARPYHPAWLKSTRTADPALAIDDVYLHVRPLWVNLCSGHKKQCLME